MEEELNKIQDRLSSLERRKNLGFWLQFFLFPLILAGMGYYFQNTVKEAEGRMEQLKMTQNIVDLIFKDTIYDKTIAMRGILYEVLDNERLSAQLGKLIDTRLENLVLKGTPEEVKKIMNAVETSGDETNSVKKKFDSSPKIQLQFEKTRKAIEKERQAFIYLQEGDMARAEVAFKQVDSIYPTFHQAYEIQRFLSKNKPLYNDSAQIRLLQKHTIQNFRYGAPKDILEKIENQVSNGNLR